jgi:hypothetical protein
MLIVQEIWKKYKSSGFDKLRVAFLTRAAPKFVVPPKTNFSLVVVVVVAVVAVVCLFVC